MIVKAARAHKLKKARQLEMNQLTCEATKWIYVCVYLFSSLLVQGQGVHIFLWSVSVTSGEPQTGWCESPRCDL